jgi:hypothetical protein
MYDMISNVCAPCSTGGRAAAPRARASGRRGARTAERGRERGESARDVVGTHAGEGRVLCVCGLCVIVYHMVILRCVQEKQLNQTRAEAASKAKAEADALARCAMLCILPHSSPPPPPLAVLRVEYAASMTYGPLSSWQAAAESDAQAALRRTEEERVAAAEQQRSALRAVAESKEEALRRAEAEKQVCECLCVFALCVCMFLFTYIPPVGPCGDEGSRASASACRGGQAHATARAGERPGC